MPRDLFPFEQDRAVIDAFLSGARMATFASAPLEDHEVSRDNRTAFPSGAQGALVLTRGRSRATISRVDE